MFLHMSVILFTGGGVSQHIMGRVYPRMQWGRGCDQGVWVWVTGRCVTRGGVCDQAVMTKGVCVTRGVFVTKGCQTHPHYGHQAGSMHPTGILSCFKISLAIWYNPWLMRVEGCSRMIWLLMHDIQTVVDPEFPWRLGEGVANSCVWDKKLLFDNI